MMFRYIKLIYEIFDSLDYFYYSHYSLLPKEHFVNILYKLQSHNNDESIINNEENNSKNEKDNTRASQNINQKKSIIEKIFHKKDAISIYDEQKYNLDMIKECLSKNISPIEFNIINENMNNNEKIEEAANNLHFTRKKRGCSKYEENENDNNNINNKIEMNKRVIKSKCQLRQEEKIKDYNRKKLKKFYKMKLTILCYLH